MHSVGIFHRDIKPENILLLDDVVKLADFGSCRGVYSKQPFTEYISTRWYRSPECLLTDGYYNYKMDVWGAGCVFFEMLSLFPLFPGTNEKDQIQKIHNILGTPPREILAIFKKNSAHIDFNFPHVIGTGIDQLIPHASPECRELISKMLIYDPDARIAARQALNMPYFKELRAQEAKMPIPREIGSGSPANGPEEPITDTPDPNFLQSPNRTSKLIDAAHGLKKKNQQGNPGGDYEDPNNNLPPIKPSFCAPETKKKKGYYNPTEIKKVLKQTLFSNNPGVKKTWAPPVVPQIQKITDHKKNYISPYSLKAIQQVKPPGPQN
eukprot:TRINITY_DN14471_c0_g1_i1.p1 TRINITY_DN14471_c0_g1~~TRINITY_DN14471_c0_g1_i1.p1  ORF type:complete len:323 (+),score=44.61 TRINITY_DN14471_c0_g1_i1:92-1060(+)